MRALVIKKNLKNLKILKISLQIIELKENPTIKSLQFDLDQSKKNYEDLIDVRTKKNRYFIFNIQTRFLKPLRRIKLNFFLFG